MAKKRKKKTRASKAAPQGPSKYQERRRTRGYRTLAEGAGAPSEESTRPPARTFDSPHNFRATGHPDGPLVTRAYNYAARVKRFGEGMKLPRPPREFADSRCLLVATNDGEELKLSRLFDNKAGGWAQQIVTLPETMTEHKLVRGMAVWSDTARGKDDGTVINPIAIKFRLVSGRTNSVRNAWPMTSYSQTMADIMPLEPNHE